MLGASTRGIVRRYFSYTSTSARGEYVYGYHSVLAALTAGKRQSYRLYLQEYEKEQTKVRIERDRLVEILTDIKKQKNNRPPDVKYVRRKDLSRMSGDRPHNGYVLDCAPLEPTYIESIEDITDKDTTKPQIYLILDSVHDPQNFGGIIRSSAFFGVSAIITCPKSSCPITPVVSRVSGGAAEFLPIYHVKNLAKFLDISRRSNDKVQTIAMTADLPGDRVFTGHEHNNKKVKKNKATSISCYDLDTPEDNSRILLVAGNEADGISHPVLGKCNIYMSIPPTVTADSGCYSNAIDLELLDSLNVSTSIALALYQLSSVIRRK